MVPNFAGTKWLSLQACHDHRMAGHQGVTKILKATKSRFYWPNADMEVNMLVIVLAVRCS